MRSPSPQRPAFGGQDRHRRAFVVVDRPCGSARTRLARSPSLQPRPKETQAPRASRRCILYPPAQTTPPARTRFFSFSGEYWKRRREDAKVTATAAATSTDRAAGKPAGRRWRSNTCRRRRLYWPAGRPRFWPRGHDTHISADSRSRTRRSTRNGKRLGFCQVLRRLGFCHIGKRLGFATLLSHFRPSQPPASPSCTAAGGGLGRTDGQRSQDSEVRTRASARAQQEEEQLGE